MKNSRSYISLIHHELPQDENFSFNKSAVADYPLAVVAKSATSRRKLNDLQLANDSTPLHLIRAFFVRSLRTPKENLVAQIERLKFFSMVGRKGQRLGVDCLPVETVFLPLYALPPTVGKLAVARKFTTGAIPMLFKFLCVNRTKQTYNQEIITVQADSEENARFQLSADYRLLLDRPIAKLSQNLTRCSCSYGRMTTTQTQLPPMVEVIHTSTVDEQLTSTEQNHSLPSVSRCGYDEVTTTYEGNRNPYSSGIFLSQIDLSNGNGENPHTYPKAEFVEWLICGNKASNRTNNASLSYEVVETISHPFKQGGNSLLTKLYENIKMLFKFKFLVLGEKRLTISIRAKSEEEARQKLQFTNPELALCVARFNTSKGGFYA